MFFLEAYFVTQLETGREKNKEKSVLDLKHLFSLG
jgi:hypothetical protein